LADLKLDPRHVWAGTAADGFVPITPVHGPNPADRDSDGNVYKVDTHGHGDYWGLRSETLDNQSRIIASQYDKATISHGKASS
jgi:hypothetical protein